MIAYTPEELIKLAETELAWCEAEMKKAAREMGHGDDWRAALEHVKNLHVEPGQQPALIRDLAVEAIEYLDNHNLVTIPPLCRDSWRMTMMSPERQLVNPFFLGGETIIVSYPTSTMAHEAKMMSMRGNNKHFSRATVFHEVIPGHHLQGFMTDRYKTYRRIFNTPFWGEGWALYWELLLWDRGFAQSPENKVGMLFWRMHRCARIIFSLSFHLEKMTPRVHRPPRQSHRPRARQRHRRGAALVHDVLRSALPGRLSPGRHAAPVAPSRAGRVGQDDRPRFPRRDLEGKQHPHRDGAGPLDGAEAQPRLHARLEVLRRAPAVAEMTRTRMLPRTRCISECHQGSISMSMTPPITRRTL